MASGCSRITSVAMTTSVSDTTTAEREDEMDKNEKPQVGAVALDAAIPSGSKGGRSRASQLELTIPPWQGARYGIPYMSGEVAIMPHGSTESTGSQSTPDRPSTELDALPTATQAVAVDAVEGARFDDVIDKVLPEPEAVTDATAPAPVPDQPHATPTRARSDRQRLVAFAQRWCRGAHKDSAGMRADE